MPLSDRQIERYSRQIIVPGISGLAQERLLAASLTVCGDLRDIEAPLAYLAGAGLGNISLATPDGDEIDSLLSRMRNLNPDVAFPKNPLSENLSLTRERSARAQRTPGEDSPENVGGQTPKEKAEAEYPHPGLRPGHGEGTRGVDRKNALRLLLMIGSAASLELAEAICEANSPAIVARLDDPVRIAIFPAPPPCPRCVENLLTRQFRTRSDVADFVAMVATTEIFKLIASPAAIAANTASMIEFEGLATHARAIQPNPRCACSATGEHRDAR
jgi:hypothetical protein